MQPYRSWQDLLPDSGAPSARTPDVGESEGASSDRDDMASAADGPPEQLAVDRSACPARADKARGDIPKTTKQDLGAQLLASMPAGSVIPDDVRELLDEYMRAEARLRQLTGQDGPADADPRELARFPLKVHTAASRLEEKRLGRRDEMASQARKRLVEQTLIRTKQERLRQEALAREREAARLASIRARLKAEQERERHARQAAEARREEQDRARWDLNRRSALRNASLARRELAAHEERQLERVRGQCLRQRRLGRAAEASDERRRELALERARARRQDGPAHGR